MRAERMHPVEIGWKRVMIDQYPTFHDGPLGLLRDAIRFDCSKAGEAYNSR